MINYITTSELKEMTNKEGLILQGCGGDVQEWLDGLNEAFTETGILLDGDTFKDVYVFKNEGLTNLLFDMENVKLHIGKLSVWRLGTRQVFDGMWLSDYLANKF